MASSSLITWAYMMSIKGQETVHQHWNQTHNFHLGIHCKVFSKMRVFAGTAADKTIVSLLISAMAAAIKSLSSAVTASTAYENPYATARFSTLDHLTQGRVKWNIVTSYLDSAAKAFGLDKQIPHDQRYERREEYLEVVYKLLEGSWEDARIKDAASREVQLA
jgi:alkanesulfonate monooxygenase SsuD/methylene tetrahydromethanopterin reductase-like flavin-dependent oxidoreductase (luciferase family)